MARTTVFKSILIGGVCALAVSAAAQAQTRTFDVPRGDLKVALDTYARQAGVELFYKIDDVRGRTSSGIQGDVDAVEALNRLLEGSGLVATRDASGVVAVAPRPQSDAGATTSAPAAIQVSDIVVSGTRIRGGDTPSPMVRISADRMREEGLADMGQVIRSVPQNFRGGQNPGVMGAVGNVNNQDFTGGSALNLRGLGPDASLTLLNGRRMAYQSFSQAVDISTIPVEAVERIEIIPDGASAIYGSDAVGGVANVILRRDFDGLAVGARYGGATDGGYETREFTATAGTMWEGGGIIAAVRDASVDPIYASQRDYTGYLSEPYSTYGGSDALSGLVSLHQAIGDVAVIQLDAMATDRDGLREAAVGTTRYRYEPQSSITLVSPSVTFFPGGGWSVTASAALGDDETTDNRFLSTGAEYNRVTLSHEDNESRSYELGGEGPLFSLGDGDARLAIGVGERTNAYRFHSEISGLRYGGEERARYAYAELNLPFVSPSSDLAGVHRLDFSAAVRSEDYDSFGQVTTPKLGLIYAPSEDVTFKASWGKSFKAPTLVQRNVNKTAYLWTASTVGGSGYPADATALMSYGGNPDLEPERAETWSATLTFRPQALPGLDVELTGFDIDYTNRVMEPISYMQALSNPAFAEFVVLSPTATQIDALMSTYGGTLYNYADAPFDPSKVVALIYDQYVNVARQKIRGLDLTASYALDIGAGRLTIRGSGSWLDSSQQTSAAQPEFDLAGTAFNPADFTGRVGAVWAQGGLTASAFVNHTAGVETYWAASTVETASFTTIDTTLNYKLGPRDGILSGLTLGLSVQNLFDKAPPIYAPAASTYIPYDATNYSGIGRFVSVSLSKRF